MNPVVVSLATVALHIATVYFGIYYAHLTYFPMLTLVLAVTVLLTAVTTAVLPPSSLIKDLHKRLTNDNVETASEMTFLDGIALIGVTATATLLMARYGFLQWLGIYIASCIAAVATYILL